MKFKFSDIKELIKPAYIFLLISCFFMSMANHLSLLCTSPLAVSLGASATLIGIINTAQTVMGFLLTPLSGLSCSKIGAKKMWIITMIIRGIACVCYAFSGNLAFYCVAQFVRGVGFYLAVAVLSSLIHSTVKISILTSGIAISQCMSALATVFTPNMYKTLFNQYGPTFTYLVCAALFLAATIFGLFIKVDNTNVPAKKEVKKIKTGGGIFSSLICVEALPVFFAGCFTGCTYHLVNTYGLLWGEISGGDIVTLMTVYAACAVFMKFISGVITDMFGVGPILVVGYLGLVATQLIIAYCNQPILFAAAGVLYAIGHSATYPALNSTAAKITTPERASLAISTYLLSANVSQIATNVIGGLVADTFGYQTTFVLFAIPPVLGLVIYFTILRKKIACIQKDAA